MLDENCIDSSSNRLPEGFELDTLKVLKIAGDRGNAFMGIRRCAAMTRKVFCSYHEPACMGSIDKGGHEGPHCLRSVAEGAVIDDRVEGIGIHIRDRSKCPLKAERTGFCRSHFAKIIGRLGVCSGTESHGKWESRNSYQARG